MRSHRDWSFPAFLLIAGPSLLSPLAASPARAAWLEASSDHFVIYGDQSETSLRRFAERLELFHASMAKVFRTPATRPSPSNRVVIFVVSDQDEVRRIAATGRRSLAGFYRARAGSTVAVIPRLGKTWSEAELAPETILFHEYAHHFMSGLSARVYPRWFVEGFAEFFSSVRFNSDRVLLGTSANHRGYEIAYARKVPIRRMLEFDGGASDSKFSYDAFYGQSWALFHYLFFDEERAGQLDHYHRLLASGASALDAAKEAFGDLDKLEKDLWSYPERRRLSALVLDRQALVVGPVNIKPLSPGAAEMMPVIVRSRSGVTHEEAVRLLPEARRIAARHPGDPTVLAALAEAEFDAGNDDAAITAADRALELDPAQINAHIQKGYALARKVRTGALPAESWRDVRRQFVRVNEIENDHPVPLVEFYLAYLAQGDRPSKNAIEGLEWAMELAPFDASIRWLVAQQMIADDRLDDAVRALAPIAYSPHRGDHTDRALKLLKEVEGRLAAAQGSAGG